jgi:TPR repeat protein
LGDGGGGVDSDGGDDNDALSEMREIREMREMVENMMLESALAGNCRAKYGHAMMSSCWRECEAMRSMMFESAVQGHEEGMYEIAEMHYSRTRKQPASRGDDVMEAEDDRKALLWFERAGRAGCVKSQFQLGGAYLHGRLGTYCMKSRDVMIAMAWYTRAARQGHVDAQISVQLLGECGVTLPGD